MTRTELLLLAAPPILGALIGYGTNDIAIRMLFRPHKAYYLFGRHIPFTPGMIPKEQARIAEKVASTVTRHLVTQEEISRMSRRLVSQENIEALVDRMLALGVSELQDPANRRRLAERLTDVLARVVAERFPRLPLRDNKLTADLAGFLADKALESLPPEALAPLREPLTTMLHGYLDQEIERLAARALEEIDLRSLIAKNVNNFPPARVEAIIYEIARKELKGIIYLGGFLGFLVGCVQAAVGYFLR